MSYSKKIDPIIYSQLTKDFTPDDWGRLALAALDQGGLSHSEIVAVTRVMDAAGIEMKDTPSADMDEPDYDAPRPLTPMENWQRNDEHNVP